MYTLYTYIFFEILLNFAHFLQHYSEFVAKVGANLLWECRNMISTINIQDLQADIFTYSDYSLAVSSEEYRMYTTGITIKGTYAEDFKARFPDDAETLIFWFDCYRKLLIG